jgi:hypothetical protein
LNGAIDAPVGAPGRQRRVLTMFLLVLVLSGAVPVWSIAALPLFVLVEYKVYQASLTATEQAAPYAPGAASLTPSILGANQ